MGTSPTEQARVRNTTTKAGTIATTERQSPTGAADEGIKAPAQRGDTNVEGAAGVVLVNGTHGDASMTHITLTTMCTTAAELLEHNEYGKRLSSDSSDVSQAPGVSRLC
ncbi:hypothetical protein BDD12DRAFT_880122 [Trichophaea hybrida]|nr:hypothetical protein BDD12DRAFT_880122 [Trichophaea hybrida]